MTCMCMCTWVNLLAEEVCGGVCGGVEVLCCHGRCKGCRLDQLLNGGVNTLCDTCIMGCIESYECMSQGARRAGAHAAGEHGRCGWPSWIILRTASAAAPQFSLAMLLLPCDQGCRGGMMRFRVVPWWELNEIATNRMGVQECMCASGLQHFTIAHAMVDNKLTQQ